ncbi:hypothetical protein AB0O01_02490 [Streptomyces sp. NPDC093252]|uniref:hypothetical protein n=1 Tax=Streptomyces sp. NPDC093252 TaxID=3154980 RepID=UPI0034356867
MHGVPLTERVIEHVAEKVRHDPGASVLSYLKVPWVEGGTPRPMPAEQLARTVFPSGRPLSPSLRAWLAYDTSLLARHGWFTEDGALAPRPVDQLIGDEMDDWSGELFAWLAGHLPECFLLPGGSDSRRILAVTEPDDEGEYPILALDLDDMPYLGLMYPGFDIYVADTAGLADLGKRRTYSSLLDHPVHGPRMRRHAAQVFAGESCVEYPFEFSRLHARLHPEASDGPATGGA